MAFNRFGAVAADLPPLYPGTINTDFGGDTPILGAIDRAVDLIVGAMGTRVYDSLIAPGLVRIVQRAPAGQTVLPALPFLPVESGSVRVWVGFPTEFEQRPRTIYDRRAGLADLPTSDFSVVLATGVITLTTALQADQLAYASYRTDPTNAAFALPSMARLAVRGAAAELGARLYTQGTQEWALVDEYRTGFLDELARLRSGDAVPDELRVLAFWQELERTGRLIGSVDMLRG